jgi:hypothetical protein
MDTRENLPIAEEEIIRCVSVIIFNFRILYLHCEAVHYTNLKIIVVSHQWCDLFYRLLHSPTRHIEKVEGGGRDTQVVHVNEATAV